MLFPTPGVGDPEEKVLAAIEDSHAALRAYVNRPRRWLGSLRRLSFARALQGSNSIEGYNASLDDAVAAVEGEELLDADQETRAAVRGYRDAMTYVLQLASDPHFDLNEALLKSLHFMMTGYDLSKDPGRWRPGIIFVRNDATGEVVYEGPESELVPGLVHELVALLLQTEDSIHVMVRAAMAHLNLVMIHPFRDGNGRMARCLQTLVLAREGIVARQFCSIEEYLGRNTQAYYDVLAKVGAGKWRPERDARPWVRFVLTAHLHQARTMLRRIKETERLWYDLEHEAKKVHLPERTIAALFDASMGFRVRNATYRHVADISEQVASRDLKSIVDTGLLLPRGEGRGRYYMGSPELRAIWTEIHKPHSPSDDEDPFATPAMPPNVLTPGSELDGEGG